MPKTPIEMALDGVEWKVAKPVKDDRGASMPYATHEGVFELMGNKLRCYRLNTGQTVFNADDFAAIFEHPSRRDTTP